jgi:N-acetylglucosamine-6-sulfatase
VLVSPDMGVGPWQHRTLSALALVLALVILQVALPVLETQPSVALTQTMSPPNIVLILTDDQRVDTLRVMPSVQRFLVEQGMTLRRAIVTNPLCCPSRATILTGRYSHTTGVYTNGGVDGGWSAFQRSESDTIATALQAAGYRTALIGKYLNGYRGNEVYVPPGWDRWFAFAEQNGAYYDYEIFDDAAGPGLVSYGSLPKDYSTDVIRRKAVGFIRSVPPATPFFLMVTPYAPHGPLTVAPRHVGAFAGAPVRLAPSVNESDVSDKPAYIQTRGLADPDLLRRRTRRQWEMLLAVDELVSRIDAALVESGHDNTLVIFTSDNGLSNGEHRWAGKLVPYEESLRVPMVVRLPGAVAAGTVSDALVSNADLAPTIADFAGASLSVDGVSLRPLLLDDASSVRDSVVLEHLQGGSRVPSFCGVRTHAFLFARYSTGEEELYDLGQDPWQLENVAAVRTRKAAELRTLTRSLCEPPPPGFSW